MRNWRTTVAGIVCILCGIALPVVAAIKGDVLDDSQWLVALALLSVGIGLVKASDAPPPPSKGAFRS